ncbi:helix-turn-helix transcriptional regulator [Sphingobacterium sp. DN00404]|uniref:Helix-turn-helix transcriptional regulator n=1 Tax=Sphingobacterium micropteri TaxID=2763501 RepID=A0ABR7YTI9_9SPHI|nr:AraC family transcriptional regulator [Sphingobacterium micropteri]MBD1434595.1 helix-turn-helix transcriptional regulator [Sphingobacterium micropteri]
MRIKAEISEIGKAIYNTEVVDSYQNDAVLQHENFVYNNNRICIKCEQLYAAGLHIVDAEITASKPLSHPWITEGPHIRFFFYLKGNTSVLNGAGNENYNHRVGMLQRNFLDTDGGGGVLKIKENDSLHYIIVKMSLDFYINLLKDELWIAEDAFHTYVLSQKPENRPNETLYMDLKMLDIIQDIINRQDIVVYRYHFIKIKLRELLFAIHQQTHYGNSVPEIASNPSDSLEKIKSYLILHMDNPPTSTELAKIFLINERKLKQNFKRKYGTTIYTFVVQARMEKAKKLLLENYNVNELALFLGYQSVSHFIKVFKTHHGCTPKEALKRFAALEMQAQKENLIR